MSKSLARILNTVFILALLVGGYVAYVYHYQLSDWYYLRSYKPSSEIATLGTQAALTDEGRRLFYRSDPTIDVTRAALVEHCQIKNDRTVELGCYLSTDKIYLLGITQPDLKNEMIVTSAHETLHAAYARLSAKDRRELDAKLEKVAAGITDPSLKERMADYAKLEPGEQDNELHSILGTEYTPLSPELETYYSRYFTNRGQVVTYSQQFNQRFDGLHDEITQLDDQIKTIKARMDLYLAADQIAQYNRLVPVVNANIDTYNHKVEQYNQYASDLLGAESAAGAK